jgi:hypothetical protein
MIDMETFIRNAKMLGLCDTYSGKVAGAKSKRQLLDIALDANGMPYMCDSIAAGWGLTKEYIQEEFEPFLNGRYVRREDGYTSAVYCDENSVHISTTAALVLFSHGEITTDRICEIHVANSNVTIKSDHLCVVYLYNSTAKIEGSVIIKADKKYGE